MTTIEVKVNNRSVLDALNGLQARMNDLSPAMADVAAVLQSEATQLFRNQGSSELPWDGLSPKSTIPMRTAKGTWPGKVLQVSSGGLAASVQAAHGKSFARIGSNKPYAAMHFFGGTTASNSMIPGKKIPARPFLPFKSDTQQLTKDAEASVLEVLQSHLMKDF